MGGQKRGENALEHMVHGVQGERGAQLVVVREVNLRVEHVAIGREDPNECILRARYSACVSAIERCSDAEALMDVPRGELAI